MLKDHVLSEKTVKNLKLDENRPDPNHTVVKVWTDRESYIKDKFSGENDPWYKKVGDWFKYVLWGSISDWFYNTKWFFKNLRTFMPILKSWRSFDYHYQVDLFVFGLKQLAQALEYYGNEIEAPRTKRIKAINELVAELEHDYEDDVYNRLKHQTNPIKTITEYSDGSVCFEYIDSDEIKKHNKKYIDTLRKERKAHFNKIFKIIEGQDNDKLGEETNKILAEKPENDPRTFEDIYNELFDGTGIEGWWD